MGRVGYGWQWVHDISKHEMSIRGRMKRTGRVRPTFAKVGVGSGNLMKKNTKATSWVMRMPPRNLDKGRQ